MEQREAYYDFQLNLVHCQRCYEQLRHKGPQKPLYKRHGGAIKEIKEGLVD